MKMYKNLIDSKPWKFSVVILIGLCALFLGLERSSNSLMSKQTIMILDYIFTLLFTAEIIIRILAANNLKSFFKVRDKEQNTNYFDADGLWNIFDLSLVVASIVSFIIQYFMNQSSHVEIFFVARLLRVSRVLRLFEVHEEIKRIERKILSVLPTIGSFLVLLSAIVFTYAIIGSHLFGECISCGKNIAGSFEDKTTFTNEMWQTDFTYFKIINWGWYYLATVIDDYSRYVISWKLFTTMKADDVKEVLDLALEHTGLDQIKVKHKPRLLSDNGPCYLSGELKEYLQANKMEHRRGAPYHPQTQGKIERYHRTMKNIVKLDNYYYPSELESKVEEFVNYYNKERYHESIDNLTPEQMYKGERRNILTKRSKTKERTLKLRKQINLSKTNNYNFINLKIKESVS